MPKASGRISGWSQTCPHSDAQQAHKHMHTHTHKSAITSKAGFPALTSLFIETVADIIGHLMDVMFKPQKLIFHQE